MFFNCILLEEITLPKTIDTINKDVFNELRMEELKKEDKSKNND